jgi:hypothetical protein
MESSLYEGYCTYRVFAGVLSESVAATSSESEAPCQFSAPGAVVDPSAAEMRASSLPAAR